MATSFDSLVRTTRAQRMRRADQVIVPREMELDRQIYVRRADNWWSGQDMRDFAATFALTFVGAMIFLA